MSAYPSNQRCPRCQYPVPPGAATCANCGLALTGAQGAAPGAPPAYPQPPAQPASGASFGTLPAADPYGGPAIPGSAGSQQPTVYGGGGASSSASTIASPFPPSPGGQPQSGFGSAPAYPGSQPQSGFGSAPAYPGSQPPPGFGSAPAYPGSQPPPGFGSAPAYPGSQPQSSFGSAPVYPGSQPAYPGSQPPPGFGSVPAYPGGQQPGGFSVGVSAPPFAPQMPPQKKSSGTKIALIALVVLVILGGAGTAIYLLTRPKPVIDVTSDYKVGSTPVGADGTTLHFTGTDFSSNSAITFLLDGGPAPGAATKESDDKGNVTADLKVTADWPKGNHTLSARDASGYEPKITSAITIVAPGEAHTPGPNGAPHNDASFNIDAQVSAQDALTGEPLQPFRDQLVVTGKPDPAGGTVCDPKTDTGQPVTQTGTSNGMNFTVTAIFTCSGTYKGGALTYTEKATSYQVAFDNGVTCRISAPVVVQDLTGSFTDANTLSGTFKSDPATYVCNNGQTIPVDPDKGTWTGTKS